MNKTHSPSLPGKVQRGFTLVELAMVLVIFSLLVGGMLMGLGAQRQVAENNESQKQLGEIRDALIGFAVANGRLPCPADPTLVSGAAGAGLEGTDCGRLYRRRGGSRRRTTVGDSGGTGTGCLGSPHKLPGHRDFRAADHRTCIVCPE